MNKEDEADFKAEDYPNLEIFEQNKMKIEAIKDFLKWLKREGIYLCTQERSQGGVSWEALYYTPTKLAFQSFGLDSAKSIDEIMMLLKIMEENNG